jgi:integrase
MRQRLRQRLRTQTIIQQWWGGLLDRPVNRIRPADIRSILAERRAQGRSAATCNRALSALSVVFEAARGWGYVEANPCRASNLRQREGRKTPRFLTPDEARRFLLAIPTDPRPRELSWRAFFALALYTGMRESELTGLRWSDVDLDGGRITVRASVDDGDPKSGHHRVLAIHPQIAPLLASMGPQPAEHLVFQGRRRKGAARRDPTQDRVIGTRKPLQRALAAAEIDKHISMHDLRHTFATIAIESGVSLRDLQEMLGHSTLAQTARYVHALGLHAKSVELIDLAIDLT